MNERSKTNKDKQGGVIMGFWNTLFGGNKNNQPAMTLTVSEVTVRPDTSEEARADQLLKDATQKRNEKSMDEAISLLQEAYGLMARSTTSYPIKTFLRPPSYLLLADRCPEAMVEFKKLLINAPVRIAKEYSHCTRQEQQGLAAMDRSVILGDMCSVMQRIKKFECAVYYQVLTDANHAVGLKLQKRVDEQEMYRDREVWGDNVDELLAKAGKEELMNALVDRCMVFAKTCSLPALDKLAIDVAALLEVEAILKKGYV
ncbi:MAG: hypothetical protein HY272_01895 [Gammaproteobacteria bacterium]|nr:hypothetical protein [Gammaproteobacteria bacterium]